MSAPYCHRSQRGKIHFRRSSSLSDLSLVDVAVTHNALNVLHVIADTALTLCVKQAGKQKRLTCVDGRTVPEVGTVNEATVSSVVVVPFFSCFHCLPSIAEGSRSCLPLLPPQLNQTEYPALPAQVVTGSDGRAVITGESKSSLSPTMLSMRYL